MRWMIAIVIVVLLAGIALVASRPDWVAVLAHELSTESLEEVASYLRSFGIWTPIVSVLLMVLQSVIAPLPGSFVAAANGVIFGYFWGTVISWIGGMAGAIVTFSIGRWFKERLGERWRGSATLQTIERLGDSHGFWIVMFARITPIISLDAIGYLAGMSKMHFDRYLLANAIGVLPGMLAYTVLGRDLAVARDSVWRVAAVLIGLGVLFLIGRWWLQRRQLNP
jgi:uncharacterized membrane protein YdjX (TVP38/TMEM64 family)